MKMKKIIFAIITVIVMAATSSAQDYNTAFGGRLGPSNGFTIKHFISNGAALEGLITARWNGFMITGLYEICNPVFKMKGLYWHYGFGAHAGSWNDNYKKDKQENSFAIGIDGIVGLEYNFYNLPISIGLDYKPGVNFTGSPFGMLDEIGISLRYTLGYR